MPSRRKPASAGQLRALVDMALRKSPDKDDPLYNEEFTWKAGTTFEPPAHLDVAKALKRGIVEEVE